MSVNISTGSQVSLLSDTAETGPFQLRPYFDGQWLKTITNIPAGRALSSIIGLLTEIGGREADQSAWDYFFEQAEQTAETDVDVNLAFFPGAIDGPGALLNLREDNLTVGHLARACLSTMVDYYVQLGTRLDEKRSWQRLTFSGGIAQRTALLPRRVAERFQSEYRIATVTEDAIFGLLVLGKVISGQEASVAAATATIARQLQD